jgi:hypothetical protein
LEHPSGAITTQAFPVISAKTPYLTLPDGKKREIKRPGEDENVTISDLEKWAAVAEAKGARIKETKLRYPWRSCLQGLMDKSGTPETQLQWAWGTEKLSFLLRVILRGDVVNQQGSQIRTVLSSFELLTE